MDPPASQHAGDADVLDSGGLQARWPWRSARRHAGGVALTALLAGILLGYFAGNHHAASGGKPANAKSRAAVVQIGETAVIDTGSRCAAQLGHALQLGIEVVNQSQQTVALRRITAVLPLGGLRAVASQWGACGLLPGYAPALASPSLAPGAAEWATVTVQVLVKCPQALPVQFKLSYLQADRLVTAELAGFPDLGQVHYNNCLQTPPQ